MPIDTSSLDRLIDAIRATDSGDIEKWVRGIAEESDQDLRPFRVMICSPLNGLKTERDEVEEALRQLAGIEVKLFEKLDSGFPNTVESVKLVDRCDFFVALFDPDSPGSSIAGTNQPYCKLEFDRAVERQSGNDWPRIFVFVKRAEHSDAKLQLQPWQSDVIRDYAVTKYFSTAKELRQQVYELLLAHNIELRTARVRVLAERLKQAEWTTQTEQAKSDGLLATNRTLQSHVSSLNGQLEVQSRQHDHQLLSMSQAHERQMAVQAGHNDQWVETFSKTSEQARAEAQKARQADFEEIERLRKSAQQRQLTVLQHVLVGAAVGAVPLLVLGVILMGTLNRPGVSQAIEGAAGAISSALAQQPLLVASVENDPMLLHAKISLARALDPTFDCGDPTRLQYSVGKESGQSVTFERDAICLPGWPMLLSASSATFDSCDYNAPSTLLPAWKQFAAAAERANLAIATVRIVGHASATKIDDGCPQRVPPALAHHLRRMAPSGQLAGDDEQIHSNLQLAYSRAWEVARLLREQTDRSQRPIHIEPDSIGILDAKGAADGGDRKVTLSISLVRRAARAS